mmetsp:Transcript_6117/g.13721  ORF Transcript_6117/g.13721 Transcript_6117/m.13721 type:complete len:85 (+) Transcript_6117:9185-9439(+)
MNFSVHVTPCVILAGCLPKSETPEYNDDTPGPKKSTSSPKTSGPGLVSDDQRSQTISDNKSLGNQNKGANEEKNLLKNSGAKMV